MDEAVNILTVGHSTHSLERFLELLQNAGVTAIGDVRSVPYSRHVPHFDREPLRRALNRAGIAYVYLGRELGARPDERALMPGGVADWELMRRAPAFVRGIERVFEGARRFTVALLCSEKEPLDCHRNLLVARELQRRGASIGHILADGTVEPNGETERRLLELTGADQFDLFAAADQDPLEAAYERREKLVVWREPIVEERAEEDF